MIYIEGVFHFFLFTVEKMARFPEAEKRLLDKKICMDCYASNPTQANQCRKCNSKNLRMKAKESRRM